MREDFLHTKDGQNLVAKLVVAAMEELVMMAYEGAPLWIPATNDNPPNQPDILNKVEYLRIFPSDPNHTPKHLWPETSRDSAMVLMDPINIVKILMDTKQWSTVFGNIVSTARTLEVLSVGVDESFNEALHEMTVEFHLPSPLVPVREHHFIRYCCQYYENLWVVVDADLSGLFQDPTVKSYKRPSGCLIQALLDGYSKVTWVENAEVNDENIQNLYFPLNRSSTTFGAKRWVSTLEGHCQQLFSSMVTPHDQISLGVIYDDKGKKSLCSLARRMMLKFYSDVSASAANHWSTSLEFYESGEMQSMVRVNAVDPGIPMGTIFSVVSSLWWPTSPNEVFELLQNYQSRHQWDTLVMGEVVEEVMRVITSPNSGNYISLLQINGTNSGTAKRLIRQESYTNSIESYLVYTKINTLEMKAVLSEANPDCVTLLPSSFAIIPNEVVAKEARGSYGTSTDETLLIVAMQKVVHWGRNLKNFKKPLIETKRQIRAIIAGIKAATLK
ncbi:hypothetical protein M0R45_035488 [Rubus argutus]|uniref:START domain-containing protein n=1 Tax=Rubus argutus TaxID=59490 RepID=A0AAW1VX54_RUBAR